MTALAMAALVSTLAVQASQDSIVRRQLAAPAVVSGVACDRTGSAYAEFFEDGTLRSCPIAADTTIAAHAFARGTWITLHRTGALRSAWLSRDTRLAGHLCHGKGYKGFAVTFHDDQSLRSCYLANDTVIAGVPCIHGSFWTEIRGGTKSVATFRRDGSLAACQLSRDVTVHERRLRKWTRVRLGSDGTISEAQ